MRGASLLLPLLSLLWSTTTPPHGPIYFPEGLPLSPLSLLSRRRSCALHTPAVLPVEFTRRTEAAIRFSSVYASSYLLVRRNPSTSPRWFNKVVQFLSCLISSSKGRLNCCGCVYFRNETGDVQPFFPRGIARGLRDMCATWAETEGPPAAPAE